MIESLKLFFAILIICFSTLNSLQIKQVTCYLILNKIAVNIVRISRGLYKVWIRKE